MHSTEQLDGKCDAAVRLLKRALEVKDWQLCRDLLRFLQSIDDSGGVLQHTLSEVNISAIDG